MLTIQLSPKRSRVRRFNESRAGWIADGTSANGQFRASRMGLHGKKEYLYGDEALRAVQGKDQKPQEIPGQKRQGIIGKLANSLKELAREFMADVKGKGNQTLDATRVEDASAWQADHQANQAKLLKQFEDVGQIKLPNADEFAKLTDKFKTHPEQGRSAQIYQAEHNGQKLIAKKVVHKQELENEVAVLKIQKLLGLRDVHPIAAYHVQGKGDYVVMPHLPSEDQPFANMRHGPKIMKTIPKDRIGELAFSNWFTNSSDRNAGNYLTREGHIHPIDYSISFGSWDKMQDKHWDHKGRPTRDSLIPMSGARSEDIPVPRRVLENALRNREQIESAIPKYVDKKPIEKRFQKIEEVLRHHDQPNLGHFLGGELEFEKPQERKPSAASAKLAHSDLMRLANDRVKKIQGDLDAVRGHIDSAVKEIKAAPKANFVEGGAIGDRVGKYERGQHVVNALKKIPHAKIAQHKADIQKLTDWAMKSSGNREQMAELGKTLSALHERLEGWQEEVNSRLRPLFAVGKSSISGTLGYESEEDWQKLKDKTHETARAFKNVSSWVANGPKEKVHISMRNGRASYNRNTKKIEAYDGRSAAHEVGHHIEIYAPGAYEAAKAYLDHRVGDEKPRAIFKGRDEYGRSDKFKWTGSGDKIDALYAGKHNKSGTTEILSMGVEGLYNDPIAFAQNDPEWFAFKSAPASPAPKQESPKHDDGVLSDKAKRKEPVNIDTGKREENDRLKMPSSPLEGTIPKIESSPKPEKPKPDHQTPEEDTQGDDALDEFLTGKSKPKPISMDTGKREEDDDPVWDEMLHGDKTTVIKQAESIAPKIQEKLNNVSPEVKKAGQDFAKEHGPSVIQKIKDTLGDVSERTLYGAARLVGATAMTAVGGALGIAGVALPAALLAPAATLLAPLPEIGPAVFPGTFEGIGSLMVELFRGSGKSFSSAFEMLKKVGSGRDMPKDDKVKRFSEDDVPMETIKKLTQEILSDLATKWAEFSKSRGLKIK